MPGNEPGSESRLKKTSTSLLNFLLHFQQLKFEKGVEMSIGEGITPRFSPKIVENNRTALWFSLYPSVPPEQKTKR